MSRIGKKPVELGDGVKVEVSGPDVTVTGPKGSLSYTLPARVSVRQDGRTLVVECAGAAQTRELKARHGLVRSLLQSMSIGVTAGFRRALEFQGVGYRGQLDGRKLTLQLGFSHPVVYDIPEGVDISMPDATHVVLESMDKQLVGQVAATIRGFRPPDAYKGKGIRYVGEQISLKEGKSVG